MQALAARFKEGYTLAFVLFALLAFVSFTQAATAAASTQSDEEADLSGKLYKIEGRVHGDAPNAVVTLHGNGGRLSVLPLSNGKFELLDIPAGAYLLEVVSNKYVYPPLRVDVSARQNGKVKARIEETNKHLSYPLELHPHSPITFFEERKGFQIMSLLKNPMVIMVALPLVVMFLAKGLTGSDAVKQQLAEMAGPQASSPEEIVAKWVQQGDNKKRR